MATLNFGTNHPLAVKLWSKKLFHEALKQTWAKKFMGESDNSLIQVLDDANKDAGDRIRYGLRVLLNGDGVSGDGTLEGNEEAMVFYDDQVLLDKLRHAVRQGSKDSMSQQRVPYNVREEARAGLTDWWADRFDALGTRAAA